MYLKVGLKGSATSRVDEDEVESVQVKLNIIFVLRPPCVKGPQATLTHALWVPGENFLCVRAKSCRRK